MSDRYDPQFIFNPNGTPKFANQYMMANSNTNTFAGHAVKQTVYIAIIGVGGVGKAFLSQLKDLTARLATRITLKLVYVSRSNKVLFDPNYNVLSYDDLYEKLEASSTPIPTMQHIIEFLQDAPGTRILVDNTSSQEVADKYLDILYQQINIVTPNKKAFSGSWELWQNLQLGASKNLVKLLHESTVGAGLPVISTLHDMIDTGDKVLKIEGVFSGTMSFLFNSFAPTEGSGGKWSEEVKKAKALGYTEPDPRDDLNGLDVARKLTILARVVGLAVQSPTSFPVQSLIPVELESVTSGEDFLQKLPKFDDDMDGIKLAAEKDGKVVRFVGSIDVQTNTVKVGLENFDRSHPIAALKGSDNIISITTERYPIPLIIQGAGAGAEVTAAGVTGDLIKIIKHLYI